MGMVGCQEEVGNDAFFYFFFTLCFSCTLLIRANSCQNVFLLQQTAELQFILEAGTGQEVWRSPASGAH